jgi:hypothetical protein
MAFPILPNPIQGIIWLSQAPVSALRNRVYEGELKSAIRAHFFAGACRRALYRIRTQALRSSFQV